MSKYLLFCSVALFSFSALSAMAEPELRIYSHYEFVRLSPKDQVTYLEALRSSIEAMEEAQTKNGMTYQTAFNENSFWQILENTAAADNSAKVGATCVFAGGLSEYVKSGQRVTCQNNRPCEGKKSKIQCEEFLYGEHVCVPAREHATRECKSASKISIEDLAKQIVASGREKWNQYKDQLEEFCNPIIQKGGKDLNLEACKESVARLNEVQTKIDAQPAAKKGAVADAVRNVKLTINSAPINCDTSTTPLKYGCFTCPPVQFDKIERPAKASDLKTQTKYGQLVDIMSKACGVTNSDSGKDGAGPMSKEELVSAFGNCSNEDFPGYEKYSDKEVEKKIKQLSSDDSGAIQKMAGGRYYNEYSLALQAYFGFEIKEAREIFCRKGKSAEGIQILKNRWPDYVLKEGHGNQSQVSMLIDNKASFMDNDEPLKELPPNFNGNYTENALAKLNAFKYATVQRRKLAKCLEKTQTSTAGVKMSTVFERRPFVCSKRFTNVEGQDIATAIVQLGRSDQTCVDGNKKSTSCRVNQATQLPECAQSYDTVESTVTAYDCKSTARNPYQPGDSMMQEKPAEVVH